MKLWSERSFKVTSFCFYSLFQFHETLEQRLLVTELAQLLGPSQERETPPLLGLEKADLLELMPPSEVGDEQILA